MSEPGSTLATGAYHKCGRCKNISPSPHEGRPPIVCLKEFGGCGRVVDDSCYHSSYDTQTGEFLPPDPNCEACKAGGTTRFYPPDWGDAKIDLYEQMRLSPYVLLLDAYKRIFRTEDTGPLDATLAAVVTSRWAGDPLWLYVVGPPSSGKTEVVRIFDGLESTVYLSSLSPKSLISGLKDGHDLLPLLDGKTLLVKDMTMTLEMAREGRDELFGALRDAYDGTFSKAFGTIGAKRYDSKFNLVAAVTSAIENYYSAQSVLGQRFLMVRTNFPKEFDADDSRDVNGSRMELRTLASTLIKELASVDVIPSIAAEQVKELKRLASDVAILRTHIHRDGSSHEIASFPEPEAPARLTNQFLKLAKGLAWIRKKPAVSEEEMSLVRRVARDTVPLLRVKILETVNSGETTITGISVAAGLPRRTIERKVEDLVMLGVLIEDSSDKIYRYEIGLKSAIMSASPTAASGGIA